MPRARLVVPALAALLVASHGYAQPRHIEQQLPCESFSASAAVFVGVAGAPVMRWVTLPEHPPIRMTLTPVTVERAYTDVAPSVMYLTPLAVQRYPIQGRRYLVYGRHYSAPGIVMASPGYGAKPIEEAAADLAFLDTLTPGTSGGTITGVVQFKDLMYDLTVGAVTPLDRVVVRIANDAHEQQAVTDAEGRFAVSVPAGTYVLTPTLPEGLVVRDSTSRITATVVDGGCAVNIIDARFNGLVRGTLRGPDGRPLTNTSVDLVPLDTGADSTGRIKGMGSVSTNEHGEFEFTGRPPGRYLLGVSLYNAPNTRGPSYPRTYYPGTTDRDSAIPITVEHGRSSGEFDLSIPAVLLKGEVEVSVSSDRKGTLKVCFHELEDLVDGSSIYEVRPNTPLRLPVVEALRYQVHAQLEFPGGHLESEPVVFTATTGRTVVKLQPDAPRRLHRWN